LGVRQIALNSGFSFYCLPLFPTWTSHNQTRLLKFFLKLRKGEYNILLKNDILVVGSFNYLSLHQKIDNYDCKYSYRNDWLATDSFDCRGCSVAFWRQKIPEMMRGMGKGIREFKDGLNPDEAENSESKTPEKKA
jgi:hypothetical protein